MHYGKCRLEHWRGFDAQRCQTSTHFRLKWTMSSDVSQSEERSCSEVSGYFCISCQTAGRCTGCSRGGYCLLISSGLCRGISPPPSVSITSERLSETIPLRSCRSASQHKVTFPSAADQKRNVCTSSSCNLSLQPMRALLMKRTDKVNPGKSH